MQTGDEKKEKYQIFQTNIMRIIWQTVKSTITEILGVYGLTFILKI